jgi:hypothetical protein
MRRTLLALCATLALGTGSASAAPILLDFTDGCNLDCQAIEPSVLVTRMGVDMLVTASESLVLDGPSTAALVRRVGAGRFGVNTGRDDFGPAFVNHLEVLRIDFDEARYLTGARVRSLNAESIQNDSADLNPAYYRTVLNNVFGDWEAFPPGPVSQDIAIFPGFADGVEFAVRLSVAQEPSVNSYTEYQLSGLFVDLDQIFEDPNPDPAPEPASLLLFGLAMALTGRSLRRWTKRAE